MSARTLIVAVVGGACVAAAGVGGYIAVRTGSIPAAASSTPPAIAAGTTATVDRPAPAPAADTAPAPAPPAARTQPETHTVPRAGQTVPVPATSPQQTMPQAPAAPGSVEPAANQPPEAAPADDQAAAPMSVTAMPSRPPEPATPELEGVTIARNSVIGIRLDDGVSTSTAKVEDRVSAHVTRDVTVDGRTAIPAGARLEGTVTLVQRGGKFKDRARLEMRFSSVVLADNTRTPIQTEAIYREGDPPGGQATAKVGAGAVVGSILGALFGGKKGAVVGTTVGAAGGAAVVANGDESVASVPSGTPLAVRLIAPVTMLVERAH